MPRRATFFGAAALTTTMLSACALNAGTTPAAAAAPPGALDPAFGGGIVELPKGTQLKGSAVQPDGKLVVTGLTGGTSASRLLVARLTPAGGLDPSFGQGGVVSAPLPANGVAVTGDAVVIQRDGKIVVAGDVSGESGADGMLVARLNPDGTLDSDFAGDGQAAVLRGGGKQAEANAVAVRPDGEIVVGGAAAPGEGPATAVLARLSPSGALVRSTDLGIGLASIRGIALQPDGKIVFAGIRRPGQFVVTFVGRANADGTKDTSFRGSGVVERSYARNGAGGSGFRAVAVQSDGKIVATGYALDGAGGQTPGAFKITTRYDTAGNPDGSFGSDGVCYTRASQSTQINSQAAAGGEGIAMDRDHLYTGGSWDESGSSAFAVQSQNLNGDADSGFGDGGQTITPFRNYARPAFGTSVALAREGLYLVGTSGNRDSDGTTGLIARYGTFQAATPSAPADEGSAASVPPAAAGSPSISAPPAGDAGPPTTPPVGQAAAATAARLGGVALSSKTIKGKGTTTLRYSLTSATRVRVTVEQRLLGRRRGSRCVKPSSSNSRGKPCVYYSSLSGSRLLSGRRGTNRVRLTRKVTSRSLKAGRYRLVLQVVKGSKTQGPRRTVSLTVAR